MTERDQALRRLLREARPAHSGETPPFDRLWSRARARAGERAPPGGRWADAFSGVAATACVLLIGLFLALDMREEEGAPDPMLYEQLIAQTAWQSPTDVLLDMPARDSLRSLPQLPAVNTKPSSESLL